MAARPSKGRYESLTAAAVQDELRHWLAGSGAVIVYRYHITDTVTVRMNSVISVTIPLYTLALTTRCPLVQLVKG